ncbi:MAG: hydrogenase expression/formation protein HypE [Candidatus Thorarchaeota archaeon]|nr:MAG: hydrogenase expression/formation protein HypE [Candidatus Thorarchaeota archaeon]
MSTSTISNMYDIAGRLCITGGSDMARIESAHGAGGRIMQQLLEEIIIPSFGKRKVGDIGLDEMDDGATMMIGGTRFIVCTDAHTIHPVVFPGGDLGVLTACGTLNDLAVMGARPVAMTNTVIVEEGFEIDTLRSLLKSLNSVIEPLDVAMVAGDTKVMPPGTLDGVVISTTGIGEIYLDSPVTDAGAEPGDDVIVTGPIGDHGTSLLAHREGLRFETDLCSDVAPLWLPIKDCLDVGGVHAMKDPTRGGTAVALNEISSKSGHEIELDESLIPIRPAVRSLCEVLGLNPLNMSCEGTVVIVCDNSQTEKMLQVLHKHDATRDATVIGRVTNGPARVVMRTAIGGRKVIQVPYGEPVPRVC